MRAGSLPEDFTGLAKQLKVGVGHTHKALLATPCSRPVAAQLNSEPKLRLKPSHRTAPAPGLPSLLPIDYSTQKLKNTVRRENW